MPASGHYTRGHSLRINNKTVSVSWTCDSRDCSPTLSIGLQADKTVDILRCAAESTDLLPPSALPRQQAYLLPSFSTPGLRPPPFQGDLAAFGSGSLRLSPPSRPAGCRPADCSAASQLHNRRFPNPCRLPPTSPFRGTRGH